MTGIESQTNIPQHKQSSVVVRDQNPIDRNAQMSLIAHKQSSQQTDVRTSWQDAQIALGVHKRSLASDTHQDQLPKVPKQYLVPQTVLNIRYTSEPTGKNAQIALVLIDGPQWQINIRTNWQECPNSTSTHRWEGCPCVHWWT